MTWLAASIWSTFIIYETQRKSYFLFYSFVVFFLQNAKPLCYTFTVTIVDAQFPNWTISEHWYSSREGREVDNITFLSSNFSIIEENAFTAAEFQRLQYLTFKNIKSLKVVGGWLNGMHLFRLEFWNSPIIDPPYDFFRYCNVGTIMLFSSFSSGNIVNIFEMTSLIMNIVHIDHTDAIKRISGMHLSRLYRIRKLFLTDCGIETIAKNTFYLMKNLQYLNLCKNRLKTLPTALFTNLFDQRNFVELQLENNLWECRCELLMVNQQLNEFGITINEIPQNCTFENEANKVQCIETNVATEKIKYKSCDMEVGMNVIYLNYPKLKLKLKPINMGLLHIHIPINKNSIPFYLIASHQYRSKYKSKQSKCIILNSIRCVMFTRLPETIAINQFDTEPLQTWCILDAELRRWPSSFISICNKCELLHGPWLVIKSKILGCLYLLAMILFSVCFGISLGFLLLRMKPKLLIGADRVVFLKNTSKNRQNSVTIFVMPEDWINPNKQVNNYPKVPARNMHRQLPSIRKPSACSIVSNDYAIISQIKFNYTDLDKSFDSPPLPPRPVTYMN